MFDKIRSFVRGVMRKMFPAKNIKEALDLDTCVSDEMLDRMNLWAAMYRGHAPWCRDPVVSLRKERGICQEFANVVLNEMEAKVSVESLDTIFVSIHVPARGTTAIIHKFPLCFLLLSMQLYQ